MKNQLATVFWKIAIQAPTKVRSSKVLTSRKKLHLDQALSVQSHSWSLVQARSFLGIMKCKVTWICRRRGKKWGKTLSFPFKKASRAGRQSNNCSCFFSSLQHKVLDQGQCEVSLYLAVCLPAAGLHQALQPRLYFARTVRQASAWYVLVMTWPDWTKAEVSDLM